MTNERLDIPLLLVLMWASFAAFAQAAAPVSGIAAVNPSVWTEGVVIALITSITTTVVSLATLFVGVLKMNKITEKVDTVEAKVDVVHKTTNSMSEALAKAKLAEGRVLGIEGERTRRALEDATFAEGVKEGSKDAVAKPATTPVPVVVSNDAPVPVKETP